MAWLITLALFWAVGSLIAKGIDKGNDKQYAIGEALKNESEQFFAEVYVIAWNYYQQLEPQVQDEYNKLYTTQHRCVDTPGTVAFEQFSEEIFGKRISQQARESALQKLASMNRPIYVLNPNLKERYNVYGKEWVRKQEGDIDFRKVASDLYRNIPNLGYCYSWETAEKVRDGAVLKFVPNRNDVRTYQYMAADYWDKSDQQRMGNRIGNLDRYQSTTVIEPKAPYAVDGAQVPAPCNVSYDGELRTISRVGEDTTHEDFWRRPI